MDEQIAQIKSSNILVFKIEVPGTIIYFREPTIGEKLQLDQADTQQGLSAHVIKSLIVRIEGELTIDKIIVSAPICEAILSAITTQAPLFSIEKTKDLFTKISEEMETNTIYRFKTWVAKELNFPEFVYLSDEMSITEFLRYIRLAEEVSGLVGMFLYSITNDESHLTDEAKAIIDERINGPAGQMPDWQQAGLKQPPRSIGERKAVQEFIRKRDTGELTPDELPPRPDGRQPRKPIDAATQEGIRSAGALLAAKMKQQEQMKAHGMPIPKFDWGQDNASDDL